MKIGNSDSDCVLGTLLVLWLVPYLHPMQFWVAGGQKVSTNCSFVWVVDAMVEQCKLLHVQVSLLGHGPQCGVLCFVSSICQRQLLSLWKVDETKWSRSERVTRSLMLRVRRKVPEGSLRLWTRIFSVALWICAVQSTRSLHLKWDFWSLLFAFSNVCSFLRIYNIMCTLHRRQLKTNVTHTTMFCPSKAIVFCCRWERSFEEQL